ncbi:rhomboid family intramembrane serine protease [Salinirubellus salinus]|uniref:Rhomboid family intramembrane serine protease n=1 Tax=Salinirubellus salinus TaxID=1364945 RepID=A0A9E7R2X9_9EURY|nr:rhomboid family intramembrane serine protease [Salinirubellus salinus]UWM54801.1 rhomboid family intramembrane serine protease [Salinirubellus salinus]
MATCDVCGKQVDLPYNCSRCGGTYCGEHRLPENHSCAGLDQWDDPRGVFDSGFDDSVDQRGGSSSWSDRLPGTSTGGFFGYFRGNVTYLFLAIMLVVYVLEFVVIGLSNAGVLWPTAFQDIFVLTSANPQYVWTWVTSVFSHSPATFTHIFGNGIVLFFFGPVVERRIGSNRFVALFLASGIVAGLGQIALGFALGDPVPGVLGASGAALAILGVLTVLNPDLKVYLYFILPVPIYVLTFGYAALSVLGIVAQGGILGNVAHGAHLVGLLLGLAYGSRVKGEVRAPGELQLGRGGGPGGPGRGRGPF